MKTVLLCGCLMLCSVVDPVVSVHAQTTPDLKKAPLRWPLIKSENQKGRFDSSVAAIQYLLRAREFYLGTPSGLYDRKTVLALKSFQRANGLQVDGIAGPKTLPKLIVVVKRGMKGDAVRVVQTIVHDAQNELGETPNARLKVDGVWGQATQKAVEISQGYANSYEDYFPVDGVVGPRSWCLLLGGSVAGSQWG